MFFIEDDFKRRALLLLFFPLIIPLATFAAVILLVSDLRDYFVDIWNNPDDPLEW